MLLKYLNELDAAVLNAKANPDQSHLKRCFECVDVLENYLQGQMEPIRRKGREIMYQVWPEASRYTSARV